MTTALNAFLLCVGVLGGAGVGAGILVASILSAFAVAEWIERRLS